MTAQAVSSKATWFLTLTYGQDHGGRALTLSYSDVQKFHMQLRKRGYKFKAATVGEYGTQKGRAHWHMILFWQTDPPKWPFDQRVGAAHHVGSKGVVIDEAARCWPHGHVYPEKPRSEQAAAAYMMKYLDKPGLAKEGFRFSQGIGAGWLEYWARRQARLGMALWPKHDYAYFTVDGNQRTRRSAAEAKRGYRGPLGLFEYTFDAGSPFIDAMCDAYLDEWGKLRPDQAMPKPNRVLERRIDELTSWFRVTPAQRRALARVGHQEPTDGDFRRTVTTDPKYPGVTTTVYTATPDLVRLEYRDEQGERLWHVDLDEETWEQQTDADLERQLGPVLLQQIDRRRRQQSELGGL